MTCMAILMAILWLSSFELRVSEVMYFHIGLHRRYSNHLRLYASVAALILNFEWAGQWLINYKPQSSRFHGQTAVHLRPGASRFGVSTT